MIPSEDYERNLKLLETTCRKDNIQYKVLGTAFGLSLAKLTNETRFADLLLVSGEQFFEDRAVEQPNEYLKDVLQHSECPVVVVPESAKFPSDLILAYDGSESSVYGIKQFVYLFPELCNNRATMVYANKETGQSFPSQWEIEELAARHFSNLSLFRMETDPQKSFHAWISNKQGSVLIAGSYGRPGWKELFKQSFTTKVIRDHRIPVFIAHR